MIPSPMNLSIVALLSLKSKFKIQFIFKKMMKQTNNNKNKIKIKITKKKQKQTSNLSRMAVIASMYSVCCKTKSAIFIVSVRKKKDSETTTKEKIKSTN